MTSAGQEQTSRGTNPAVAQVQLFEEAQRLLQSMRLAAVSVLVEERDECPKVSEIQPPKGKDRRGLLDGGASHALRTARPGELESARNTQVSLALGQVELGITPEGTLLNAEPVAPILPLGVVVAELNCRVEWTDKGFQLHHRVRGRIETQLEGQCPTVPEQVCLFLIGEIEEGRRQVGCRKVYLQRIANRVAALSGDEGSNGVDAMLQWLKDVAWDAPDELLARVPPSSSDWI